MPQKIDDSLMRICKGCGKEFHPSARKQFYCNCEKSRICEICEKEFTYKCDSMNHSKTTCSYKCARQLSMTKSTLPTRKCKWCNKEFIPKTSRQMYCDDTHYQKCVVCGKEFKIIPSRDDSVKTCSKDCRYKLASSNHDFDAGVRTLRERLKEKYGVDNIMKLPGVVDKIKATNLKKYGKDYYTQTAQYKERVEQTSLKKYGVKHHAQSKSIIQKRIETCIKKYGRGNILASQYGKELSRKTIREKYGVEFISQCPEIKRKMTANSRLSKLERRICDLFDNYNIEYIQHHFISNNELSHEFDFYLPKYKILIDADGLYWHSYLDDPDGKRVLTHYDNVRMKLIPKDYMFFLIVEDNEDRHVKEIVRILSEIDDNIFNYDSYLFNWCRSIEFPYPSYSKERMLKDYNNLCRYKNDKYNRNCRIGESIIKHYHRSIYDCKKNNLPSPKEAWYNDTLLKRIIKNRLIYVNDVDPSKILTGFNISGTAKTISIFNPVLAKYIISKYLNDYNEIFDPFSGFSGRLLGASSLNKKYIGYDINEKAISESNEIIKFLKLDKASITKRDVLDGIGQYESLLTCPPYKDKEIYNKEKVFKECDLWIDEILKRYKCKRYVFVVDETVKYKEYIKETITNTSHFGTNNEYIIVIDQATQYL